jgi:hypothetical protein
MYLSHVVLAIDRKRVGALFGRDRTTAAHACSVIEERRDDPAFNMVVSVLEDVLRYWLAMGVRFYRALSKANGDAVAQVYYRCF